MITYHHNFLCWLLLPHQHGSEVHATSHGDVQAEQVLLHPMLILDLAPVLSLVLLLHLGEPEDDLSRSVGPALASWFCRQVFGTLKKKYLEKIKNFHIQLTLNHVTVGTGSPTMSRKKKQLFPSSEDTLSDGFTNFGSFPLATRGDEVFSQS